MNTKTQTAMNAAMLTGFIGARQLNTMLDNINGEEGQFFIDKINEMAERIKAMPKTYETDGQGDEAIVYLHYFNPMGHGDWWITEKDVDPDGQGQIQAFGYADLGYPELGYINIAEVIRLNMEIDLFFDPVPLREIKKQVAA